MALKITIVICATLVMLTLINEKGKGGNIYETPELRSNKMIAKKCNACSSVYLSGPITGLKEEDARAAFEKAEKLLEAEYERVVNPMRFESGYRSANLTYDEIMDIDIRLLKMCKTIYMLKKLGRFKGRMH